MPMPCPAAGRPRCDLEIGLAGAYYLAEDDHQQYRTKTPAAIAACAAQVLPAGVRGCPANLVTGYFCRINGILPLSIGFPESRKRGALDWRDCVVRNLVKIGFI